METDSRQTATGRSETRGKILQALAGVAPEAAGGEIDETSAFREQFDFDSIDFLNFAIALSKAFGIEIPERDYPRLSSLSACLEYLSSEPEAAR